jgi:hypothetical protein
MTGHIAEETGQFVVAWRPGRGPVTEAAPLKAVAPADTLGDLDRDQDDPDVVVLPGFVRYRVGKPHPTDPFRVYLHREDPFCTTS